MVKGKQKESLHKRMRFKYRLSVLDEQTWNEKWHVRLSAWSVIAFAGVMFVLTLALFSLVILYTPIRNYLPGYSENIRQQLVSETVRVDSIQTSLEVQRRYLDIIKQVVAGEVQSDTVQSLDSMQLIMREELLEAKNEVTQEFIAQYEEKEKDNLSLFAIQDIQPALTFFRPAHGVVVRHFGEKKGDYSIAIQTPKRENITVVLAGTVVMVNHEIDNTYTMLVQHTTYLSLYRHIMKPMKQVGEHVQAGESLGLESDEDCLEFELWQNGSPINPEEVIAL